jgi:uncharacterized membrane protein
LGSAATGNQAAARELRQRVLHASDGALTLPRDELVAMFRPGENGKADPAEAAEFAQAIITQHGLVAMPGVNHAAPAASVRLVASRSYALQGAAVAVIAATVLGYAGRPLYGLLMGGAGAIGLAVLIWRFEWLDGTVPAWVPRGRLLGLLVTVPLSVVAFLAAVEPLRASGRDDHKRALAARLVGFADAAIDKGQLQSAQQFLFKAEAQDPGLPTIADVRAHLITATVKAQLDDFARKEGTFDQAERAFQAGDTARAIALMSSLGDFRDAPERLRAIRAAQARPRNGR